MTKQEKPLEGLVVDNDDKPFVLSYSEFMRNLIDFRRRSCKGQPELLQNVDALLEKLI